jgi:hypothetical protein
LGDYVKDIITGYDGIVYYRSIWLNNCNVYGLKSLGLSEEGNLREAVTFDEPELVLIKKNYIDVNKDDINFKFKLGDKVKHMHSDIVGIIYGYTQWFNGCNVCGIRQRNLDKDYKLIDLQYINEKHLELIEEVKSEQINHSTTGGPTPKVYKTNR